MGILDRISTVVKANVNDLISKAENPEKVLDQAILDMESDHKKAKAQIIDSLAMQKQAEIKLTRLREDTSSWEKKAMAAVQAGNDELAREALLQKNKIDTDIAEYESSVASQASYVTELKSSITALEAKITEAKQKRDQLIKRFKQAQAAQQRAKQVEAASGAARPDPLSATSAFDTFDRMVDKIEGIESHVEAQRELMGGEIAAAETGAKLEELSVDEQLRQLKNKQSGGQTAAAPAPPAVPDPVEDQLAALKRKLQGG
ncbi:MAG: PspA/IM30 family protein [Pseudomonadota bacterium]